LDARRDRESMGRSRRSAEICADRSRRHAVPHDDHRQPDREPHRAAIDATEPRRMSLGGDIAGSLDLRSRANWRATKNSIMTIALGAAVAAVAIPLVLVMVSVFAKGGAILFDHFPDFLTKAIPPTRVKGAGMGPAVVGTLMITGMATLIAVPLGVLGAIYL